MLLYGKFQTPPPPTDDPKETAKIHLLLVKIYVKSMKFGWFWLSQKIEVFWMFTVRFCYSSQDNPSKRWGYVHRKKRNKTRFAKGSGVLDIFGVLLNPIRPLDHLFSKMSALIQGRPSHFLNSPRIEGPKNVGGGSFETFHVFTIAVLLKTIISVFYFVFRKLK